jgi:ADP-ribosylglycohydrolase
MRYSLLSRFQGTLMGAALGEILGVYCRSRLQAQQPLTHLESGHWAIAPLQPSSAGWGSIAIDYAHQLIQAGAIPAGGAGSLLRSAHGADRQQTIDRQQTLAGVAIAALPIALFFHEDRETLRLHLSNLVAGWQGDPELLGGVLAVGYAIALALRERLYPDQLGEQLIAELDLDRHSPTFAQQLSQVQTWVQQKVGLASVLTTLASSPASAVVTPFSLAFYCFLSTPEQYALAMLRSVAYQPLNKRSRPCLGITSALTGALSGAYNSYAGIPVDWRIRLSAPSTAPPLVGLWAIESEAKMKELANRLLAAWSGVYDPLHETQSTDSLPVTAAPHVIRPR